MVNSKGWLTHLRQLVKGKKRLRFIGILAGTLCLSIFLGEIWLNYWVRAYLRQSLGWGGPQVEISAHLNWLSLADIIHGRVGWVRVEGQNCLIGNLRFAKLDLKNEGFVFNLPLLFREKRLELIHLNKTRIKAMVTAPDFSNYLNLYYPQFKPLVKISPGRLILSGRAQVFGNTVPAELAGVLRIAPPRNLRFYPTRLFISGNTVPQSFLHFVATQIPLQISLMTEWPLTITAVRLGEGYVQLDFKEIN